MRLSTAGMHRTSIDAILEHQYQMARTQQQITTGKKFQTAADDPIGATRAAVLDRTVAENEQYGRNSNIIESRLNYEEQSLADATSLPRPKIPSAPRAPPCSTAQWPRTSSTAAIPTSSSRAS